MRIFPVGDILKGMSEVNIGDDFARRDSRIPLPILNTIPEPQTKQDDHHKTKASNENRECQVVSRCILVTEYLRAHGVTSSPKDEVAGNDD